MNLDLALVNRALMNINMDPLPAEKYRDKDSKEWQTAYAYYLSSMLEALAQVEWTGAKRRRELAPAQTPVKHHAEFAYVYCLPIDCAKTIELDGHELFAVEAGMLFTSARPARLLYISNGKRLYNQTVILGGDASRPPTPDYVSGGNADRARRHEWGDNVVAGGNADTVRIEVGDGIQTPSPPEAAEDYPDYRTLELEPNFYLYWEYLLSARFAQRLADQPSLADSWFAKAAMIGGAAEAISLAGSSGRRKAPDTWQEQMGLIETRR